MKMISLPYHYTMSISLTFALLWSLRRYQTWLRSWECHEYDGMKVVTGVQFKWLFQFPLFCFVPLNRWGKMLWMEICNKQLYIPLTLTSDSSILWMIIGAVNKQTMWAVHKSTFTTTASNIVQMDWTNTSTKKSIAKRHWSYWKYKWTVQVTIRYYFWSFILYRRISK